MPRPRVLVTRTSAQGGVLEDALWALGADPVLVPTIEIGSPASFTALDSALRELPRFDWLVFTSGNAVVALAGRARQLGLALTLRPQPQVAAIGAATAAALAREGLATDLTPPRAIGEALADALVPSARSLDGRPNRFLLPRAELARDVVHEALTRAGADVTVVAAYRTLMPADVGDNLRRNLLAPSQRCAAVTFTSSSSARHFFAALDAAELTLPAEVLRVSIGPITSQTLRELGYPAHVQSASMDVASLASATMEALRPGVVKAPTRS